MEHPEDPSQVQKLFCTVDDSSQNRLLKIAKKSAGSAAIRGKLYAGRHMWKSLYAEL
jgi:hypothetical protein